MHRFQNTAEAQHNWTFCQYFFSKANLSVNTSHSECCIIPFPCCISVQECSLSSVMSNASADCVFCYCSSTASDFLPQRLLCQEEAAHLLWCFYSSFLCTCLFIKSCFKSENWCLNRMWNIQDPLLRTRSGAALCLCVKCFADWSKSFRI